MMSDAAARPQSKHETSSLMTTALILIRAPSLFVLLNDGS